MNVLGLTPNVVQQLSFSQSLSSFEWQNKSRKVLSLTVAEPCSSRSTVIRMGGGPRTYPGGVSKWQWKRMQTKKAKQLLKARLCRERQIYEMRKRAELKAAVSELERPWDVVDKSPKLLSVSADEQVKVLADRFQKPGGFDLWTEKDGPQLFQTSDELPSARFFPKGVVHSIKPYRKVNADDLVEGLDDAVEDHGDGGWCSDLPEDVDGSDDGEDGSSSPLNYGRNGGNVGGGLRKNGSGRRFLSRDVDWSDDGEHSSPLNYGRNGGNVGGGLRKNESGRRFLSEDVEWSDDGEHSSPLSYGRSGVNAGGGLRKNGKGRRFLPEDVGRSDDGEHFSPLTYGRNGVNVDGRMGKNGNGRKFFPKGVDGLDDGEHSSPLNRGRNGVSFDGKFGNKESARKILSNDGDRSGGSGDSRLRREENGRRFVSKDVNGSNGMYAGRDGSGRKQRGSNSIAGKRYGRYTRGTSGYASHRVTDADSEVYDMGLQQDGSYGFPQKSEQPDSTSW